VESGMNGMIPAGLDGSGKTEVRGQSKRDEKRDECMNRMSSCGMDE
jgi:hypothetical protein